MASFPAVPISNIFNTADYNTIIDGNLSLAAADLRYLKLSGGIVYGLTTFSNSLNVIGTLSINGSAIDLSLISGVVAGTPQNSKALSLDALGKINGDLTITGALSCSQLNANLTSSGLSWQSIAGTSTIALNHTLNGTALLGSTTNTAFGFLTNNTERARILSNGNFGIGTASAGYKLDVAGDINTNTLLRANRTTNGQSFNSTNGTSTCVLYHFNNGDAYFGTSTVNNLLFQTQNVARMIIGSTGAITGISSLTASILNATTGGITTVNSTNVNSTNITCNTITGDNGAGSSILNLAYTALNINGTSMTSTAAELNYVDVSVGVSTASKALVMDASNKIGSIGELGFSPLSLLYKTVLRADTSGGAGIEFYDTQFSSNNPNLNFRNDNNSSPVFMEMSGFLNNNRTTWTANGMPHQILYKDGAGFTAGLNITCMNITQATNTNANVILSARNGTIPHVVVNDQNNQLHLFPQDLVELNTSYAQNVIVGEEILVRKTLCIGTSQDIASSRLISALNADMATSSSVYLCLGQNNTSNNQAEISFYYANNGSASNRLEFGFFGGAKMFLLANGRLGLGTNNPLAAFHCTTSVSTTFATSGVYGEYGSASSSSGNLGPITRNIAIRATDSFLTNGSYFAQSDRRVKRGIRPIELDEALDFIKNVRPVKYKLINEDDTKPSHNGYIAQELKNHIDLLNFSECDDLPKKEDGDIENVMLSIDYAKVSVLLHRAILDLYDQIDKLKKKD